MILLLVLVFTFLGLINNGATQIIQSGKCNLDTNSENVDITNFIGGWHELHRAYSSFQDGDCSEVFISQRSDGTIDLYVSGVNKNFYEDFAGVLTQENGTSKVVFNSSSGSKPVELTILLTDNSNFVVLYSCDEISATERSVNIWVLGKERKFSNDLIPARINTVLNTAFGVSLTDLRDIDHSDNACYILPVLAPGQSVELTGQCDPNIKVEQNFDFDKYKGVWHEVYAYESDTSQNKCYRTEYSPVANGVISVENSHVRDQNLLSILGTAKPSADGSGKFTVELNFGSGVSTQELWVLETDYNKFSVVYACDNLANNRKRVYSWVLSRTRRLSDEAKAAVDKVVDRELFLNYRYYKQTDQSDDACFFYPEPEAGKPVVFRGQCNDRIPVLKNFDASNYTGIWHDTESYPSIFQTGKCRNANYRLEDGSVAILNTQVINETLLSMAGVAVLVPTDDNSAKLKVSFPIEGTNLVTTTDYWVLATDYTSYSLVYTCVNITEDEKQVWSWKLSRNKQLDADASIAINNVINGIQELDQRYYQPVDQSPANCFYYPEPTEGVPVIFPGQCDETIPVEQNFNLNRFTGTWYEYQTYPKEQVQGQCISHEYTTGDGNTLNLETKQIIDQFMSVSNGILGFQSNDSSAKMNIRITANGENITIPFWILGTDYENYALAYSCVNQGNDFRAVYSWKLGRSKQLGSGSLSTISNLIEKVDVLAEKYYERIDQSGDACFYLPVIPAGDAIILPGQCDPNIPVVQDFNATAYLGKWRLIESYGTDFQNGDCNTAEYTGLEDGTVDVYNTQVIDVTLDTIRGSARVASSGKLLVKFPNSPGESDYWILSTDYDSYALVYSCRNINLEERRVWSWKLSRTRTLLPKAKDAINAVVNQINVLNNRYYYEIKHADVNCFYFPEPNGQTVIFPGKCDESIRAVPAFNENRYTGLWYNIELYPSAFILGNCSNARYSPGSQGVIVYNTEVVNQTLSDITGLAVVASTDGSAKLEVDFGFGGTTPYWVLATDYDFYSLVYTCVNLDDESRQVTTWKLSRTKVLEAQSIAAINNVINSIQVLDNRYYETVDQTRDGCFYYPEPSDEPVMFPGQCSDSNVSVVQNFDLTKFEGTWYEIETYPKEQQQGECISHRYTTGTGNTLNLESSQVYGQTLGVTSGTLSFTSNDKSAQMLLNINAGGTQVEFPFWIVNTDYDDYALAYSCVDVNKDYRRVFSWKLSRTREFLSNNANISINTAISEVDVLRQEYYKNVDQSDKACFYLPDLEPNQPVIFPGQCDPNITAVPDFNATAYVGKWLLIETYATEFQDGECNRAEYTALDDGTVDVYNTQVIKETLDSIRGSARIASNDGSGKLLVSFPTTTVESDYWVLSTDYNSYALVYSCRNISPDQRKVWSWKLSRTSQLSTEATDAINQVVNQINVLDAKYYKRVDQSDKGCFYFPEPSDQVVIFPGQCDENIEVVQKFEAEDYLGLWHNIERYPSAFFLGTCSNARYSLNDSGVVVYNTEVVNQNLSEITGLAVVASTDGSAKLEVDFSFGRTTPYWVLATDYLSYSLVYTCINLDTERRQVTSWKLSKTKTLEPDAIAAIDKVINTVQVLDNRYFIREDQSRNGCFYYPEPSNEPVKFPGQCEDSVVPVVQNFNLNRFEGTWYEIETYPKEQQQGECISHRYTTGTGNTLNLESSQVYGQTLGVNSGSLSFTSNDNSAQMLIQLTANGTEISFPFWIVNTDYDNYALAYSCINIDKDYRRVFSWKLSRTRDLLSNNANTAINNAMAGVDVLRQEYYKKVDQSDKACFYLPDLEPTQPVIFPGQCDPNISVEQNFNASAYVGKWRLIESYATEFQDGECNRAEYTALDDGTVDVYNTQVIKETLDSIRGSARIASNDGSGKLLVSFPTTTVESDYWVLSTDYNSYALVYSCRNISPDQRKVWSWKLSRTSQLSTEATDAINQVVNQINVLDAKYYKRVDQSDKGCFYFPEPSDQVVIFPGQCDENIEVVQKFEAEDYLGLWHNIERYPSAFFLGTCSNARYSLNDSGVVVYNTEVVNQNLSEITGLAVVASTDGSAKLEVDFSFGRTTPYWVLATDYLSYSLVYTCINLDTERRQVTSWKLSKTKTLEPDAIAAIDKVINTVQVLDNRYFIREDQSRNGCFYYPEPSNEPVKFPGQCEDSVVPVVQNFNLNRFEGTWYEIETYPKEQQQGECISHRYTTGTGNTLNLESSQVYGQTLGVNSGSLSFTSNDNSAQMLIQLTANGTEISFPFWIVNTDYDNYALAYSCINIDKDYRRVFSWKLSRTRDLLSNNANTAINNAMAGVDVLRQEYYKKVDQSDKACFYLPDLEPTQPVIFPGQCDPNISVEQNFNASAYVGKWRLIESYATEFQDGECNRAEYTALDDGTVDVYNTQVIKETLDSIRGSARIASNDGSGKLLVSFPTTTEESDYWVLSTDYDSYALVYSCRNIDSDRRRVWSWKLSRTRSLSQQATDAINKVVDGINVLDSQYYNKIEQGDSACFYYPVPNDQPVTFPGQCDESITVMPNFAANRYEGLWYDIESYPMVFQTGTCPTAEYKIKENGEVDVFNTQVVNQQLDTINGIAVVASTDGSAKLEVTFPIAGTSFNVTTPYWVLDTDYDNYALVYSCSNMDEESRRVTSWKLSRGKSLSEESKANITNALNKVQVLKQDYYKVRGHDDVSCFFYPENNGGPVILDGQCDPASQIGVVPNFDASRFSGTWLEYARFPSEIQTGECSNSEYTNTQNGFNVTFTSVNNESLESLFGTVVIPNAGSGVLELSLTGDGVNFNENVYVLDTDYDEFALLYSCRNINKNQKQVYSWKYTRSRSSLSDTAKDRINTIVSERKYLFEGYYENTAQDNAACFYYPEFEDPLSPIILPGPCPTIRGVPDLNIDAFFSGQWNDVESLPQQSPAEACLQIFYNQTEQTNVYDLLQLYVIERTLYRRTGNVVPATDGSGSFIANYDNVPALDRYILATDYTDYALLYHCSNLEGNQRQVTSWKLSRSRTLSNAARTAISEVVARTEGLRENYYRDTSHSAESCFYVPTFNPNETPTFRGSCANINGMQNFDLNKYLGWWHEIQRYPSDSNVGECRSTQYQSAQNQVRFVDTSVFEQTGQLTAGTVAVGANGRLIRTLSNGQQQELWVLATDYDTYSLLFSCETVDDEYIRIWSAKYSKKRGLSQQAESAMAPIIAANEFLYDNLYINVDQSNSTCFYYPEPNGLSVTLPGQCDETIPTEPNFEVAAYTGTWYQIERYPYPQVPAEATCIGARYTLDEATNTVAVLNWQVLGEDQELQEIEGSGIPSSDGSGKFSVTLPVPGTVNDTTTTDLYILATDYVTYSLGYTCRNINLFERAVVAFKLSRTRSLPSAGVDAINAVVSRREELHQPFFIPVTHYDDCKEPNASYLIKSSIIVVLVCFALQILL